MAISFPAGESNPVYKGFKIAAEAYEKGNSDVDDTIHNLCIKKLEQFSRSLEGQERLAAIAIATRLEKFKDKNLSDLSRQEKNDVLLILQGLEVEPAKKPSFFSRFMSKPAAAATESQESGYASADWEDVSLATPSKYMKKTEIPRNEGEALEEIRKHGAKGLKTKVSIQERSLRDSEIMARFSLEPIANELARKKLEVFYEGAEFEGKKVFVKGDFPVRSLMIEDEFDSKEIEFFETSRGSIPLPSDYIAENIESSQFPYIRVSLTSEEKSQWISLRERSQGIKHALDVGTFCEKITSSPKMKEALIMKMLLVTSHVFITHLTQNIYSKLLRYQSNHDLPLSYLKEGDVSFEEIPGVRDAVRCKVSIKFDGFGPWLDLKPEGEDNPRLKSALETLRIIPAFSYTVESSFLLGAQKDAKTSIKDIQYSITMNWNEEL